MILAVASGKGGTGKTTVSASLASVWPSPVVAVDLDVEEPNLHLFMNPAISVRRNLPISKSRKSMTNGAPAAGHVPTFASSKPSASLVTW